MSHRNARSVEDVVYRKLNWYKDPVVEPIVVNTAKTVFKAYADDGKTDPTKYHKKWTWTVDLLEEQWNFTVDVRSLKVHGEYIESKMAGPNTVKFNELVARTALNNKYPMTYVHHPTEISTRSSSADKALMNKVLERMDTFSRNMSDMKRQLTSTKSTSAIPPFAGSLSLLKSLHASAKTQNRDNENRAINEEVKCDRGVEDSDIASIDGDDGEDRVVEMEEAGDGDAGTERYAEDEDMNDDGVADGVGDSDRDDGERRTSMSIAAAEDLDSVTPTFTRKRPREVTADFMATTVDPRANYDKIIHVEHQKRRELNEAERLVTEAQQEQALLLARLDMAKQKTLAAKVTLKARKKPISTAGQRSSSRAAKGKSQRK